MKEVGKWRTVAIGEAIKQARFFIFNGVSDFDGDTKVFYVCHAKCTLMFVPKTLVFVWAST